MPARTRPLVNGPGHGVRIPMDPEIPQTVGVAYRLVGGGYALYRWDSEIKAFLMEEYVTDAAMRPAQLEEVTK